MPVEENEATVISRFLKRIWKSENGFVYIALKHPETLAWMREFFHWPFDELKIVEFVLKRRDKFEVYFAPAIFNEPGSAEKPNVRGAFAYWIEYDGKSPVQSTDVPIPSLVVQSSDETHRHIYWITDNMIDPEQLELVNRSLTYTLNADSSGWDCTQVLRIPNTLNHKKSRKVLLKSESDGFVTSLAFKHLPTPPPLELEVPEDIPPVDAILPKYEFKKNVWSLFRDGVPEGSRSDGLMALGYYLAEMNLNNGEMLSLLLSADGRWGKFAKRQDQHKRLMEIVTRARLKYPYKMEPETPDERFIPMGYREVLETEVKLEWVWEGLLHKQGYFLLTGPTGVGKTQFTTAFGTALALGKDFLGRSVPAPTRFGFFSLEMGLVELKLFLQQQSKELVPEELELLQENFKCFAIGEPIYITNDVEKAKIEQTIVQYGFQGIIIDSLGSTTQDELSGETQVKLIVDWVDHIRQKYGCFVWLLHHHRKAQANNKRPNKISDVYGNQYITARATTVLALWDTGIQNTLECIPLKIRLAPKELPFYIYKDQNLNFTEKKGYVPPAPDDIEEKTEEMDLTDKGLGDTLFQSSKFTQSI